MLETLRFYLELAAAQCLSIAAGASADPADYAIAGAIGTLVVAACWQFVRGLRGRDASRIDLIKRRILDD